MKLGSTLFLKSVILLIAVAVFAGLIRFPLTEGRAANLDLFSIYTDPLIIYSYLASIPFFVGLYQTFKLLNLIDANKAFSKNAVNTLNKIKFVSISLIGLIALALVYIHLFIQGEDPAGPTSLGIITAFTFAVIAAAADILQKLLLKSLHLKTTKKAHVK